MINIRDGKGKEEDRLPSRFLTPAKVGFREGKVPPLQKMLKEYYEQRGWDDQGEPGEQTLKRLEIAEKCKTRVKYMLYTGLSTEKSQIKEAVESVKNTGMCWA